MTPFASNAEQTLPFSSSWLYTHRILMRDLFPGILQAHNIRDRFSMAGQLIWNQIIEKFEDDPVYRNTSPFQQLLQESVCREKTLLTNVKKDRTRQGRQNWFYPLLNAQQIRDLNTRLDHLLTLSASCS
ncbi:MAG: hypothetical protein R3A45_01445 [Bdellovibrionota bacterium]